MMVSRYWVPRPPLPISPLPDTRLAVRADAGCALPPRTTGGDAIRGPAARRGRTLCVVFIGQAPRGGARLRRAMAPRADAWRVTMLRSLKHVGEGTQRRTPRRPSRCTAPEARRAQDCELPYRAEPARLTSEAPYATQGKGGGGRHPPPFCTIASVGKVASGIGHRETIIGKGQYRESVIGEGQYREGYHRGGQYREGQYRGRLKAKGNFNYY